MIFYLWRMLYYCVYFQKEYYATHQLFLTHRALYLAIWKLTDGEEGVRNLHFWLLNIQVCLATVIKQLCANLNICRQKPSGKVMTLSLGRTYLWWCPITMSSMWFKNKYEQSIWDDNDLHNHCAWLPENNVSGLLLKHYFDSTFNITALRPRLEYIYRFTTDKEQFDRASITSLKIRSAWSN